VLLGNGRMTCLPKGCLNLAAVERGLRVLGTEALHRGLTFPHGLVHQLLAQAGRLIRAHDEEFTWLGNHHFLRLPLRIQYVVSKRDIECRDGMFQLWVRAYLKNVVNLFDSVLLLLEQFVLLGRFLVALGFP